MGATNHTANYTLSQFVGNDKPSWLQDYNGDMTKIDAGINAAKVAADSAALDAGAAQSDATAANSAITSTINPAITSLQNTVGTQGGAINTINSLIGNGTPTTTDQTIIGAINEINARVSNKNFDTVVDITSYTSANPYSVPDDGYLEVRAPYGIGNFISVLLNGVIEITSSAGEHAVGSVVFVRKGMEIYTFSNLNGTSKYFKLV